MLGFIPPSLRTGYLKRFAMWLGVFWITLAVGVALNPELAADPWLVVRLTLGTLGIAALVAIVHTGQTDT